MGFLQNLNLLKTRAPSHQRAMTWFRNNLVPGKGVIVHTRQPVPYPEVTGYYIPTLYDWGETEHARQCMRWLLSVQLPDGAFPAPDGAPYTFDTGQVLRGFCAALPDMPEIEAPMRRCCDWLLTQVDADGRVRTPSTELWGDIASELIHTYVLPPLARAGEMLGVPLYGETARRALAHYTAAKDLAPFNRLSHFHAYAMEAMWELNQLDQLEIGMAEVEACQRPDGSVPGYPDKPWVCSTGLAQYALIWYRMGRKSQADRAMRYLERMQNPSGGFFGSYGTDAAYIPKAEISWAVKYFLDAWHLKLAQEGKVAA